MSSSRCLFLKVSPSFAAGWGAERPWAGAVTPHPMESWCWLQDGELTTWASPSPRGTEGTERGPLSVPGTARS